MEDRKYYQERARQVVRNFYNDHEDRAKDGIRITPEDVLLVWYCKVLQNWKALVITATPDQCYYEVTYDGDEDRIYLDEYRKASNTVI